MDASIAAYIRLSSETVCSTKC